MDFPKFPPPSFKFVPTAMNIIVEKCFTLFPVKRVGYNHIGVFAPSIPLKEKRIRPHLNVVEN